MIQHMNVDRAWCIFDTCLMQQFPNASLQNIPHAKYKNHILLIFQTRKPQTFLSVNQLRQSKTYFSFSFIFLLFFYIPNRLLGAQHTLKLIWKLSNCFDLLFQCFIPTRHIQEHIPAEWKGGPLSRWRSLRWPSYLVDLVLFQSTDGRIKRVKERWTNF